MTIPAYLAYIYEHENGELNQRVHDLTTATVERQQRFEPQDLRLRVRRPGLLDSIYFEEVPEAGPLDPNDIEVEVRAIGVNFRDCLISSLLVWSSRKTFKTETRT